jgi:hypothetical protein
LLQNLSILFLLLLKQDGVDEFLEATLYEKITKLVINLLFAERLGMPPDHKDVLIMLFE